MSKYAVVLVAVLIATSSLHVLKGQSSVEKTPRTAPSEQLFAGKVLVITLKSDPDTSLTIEDPTVMHTGGRDFLVGKCIDDSSDEEDWREGLTVWTAMDDISQVVEVRDREELRKHLQGEEPEEDTTPTRV